MSYPFKQILASARMTKKGLHYHYSLSRIQILRLRATHSAQDDTFVSFLYVSAFVAGEFVAVVRIDDHHAIAILPLAGQFRGHYCAVGLFDHCLPSEVDKRFPVKRGMTKGI